jgi:prepilin-type N-terminal cleavage/methylation domain-containing protein
MINTNSKKGFTLIELLVVIGIVAVLLAITLVAINPAKQFQQANDTKRRSDVNTILNAVTQYMADNNGTVPAGITTTVQNISNSGANVCSLLVPEYLAGLPRDPSSTDNSDITSCTGAYDTGYQVVQSSTHSRITVSASGAEGTGVTISVTR